MPTSTFNDLTTSRAEPSANQIRACTFWIAQRRTQSSLHEAACRSRVDVASMAFPPISTVATIRPPSTTRGHLTVGSREHWRRLDPDLGDTTGRFPSWKSRSSSGYSAPVARIAPFLRTPVTGATRIKSRPTVLNIK
ncbi:hypothetical protein ACLKA6_018239 [Drosophila palustris]